MTGAPRSAVHRYGAGELACGSWDPGSDQQTVHARLPRWTPIAFNIRIQNDATESTDSLCTAAAPDPGFRVRYTLRRAIHFDVTTAVVSGRYSTGKCRNASSCRLAAPAPVDVARHIVRGEVPPRKETHACGQNVRRGERIRAAALKPEGAEPG
jgi:hypothetical protein